MRIEPMQEDDWPACARIYAEGLENGTFEESVPDWTDWNARHLPTPRLVARKEGDVLAWAALAPVSQRPCYRGVVENSIYVARSSRRRGVGHALLAELVMQADRIGIWTIQAGILAGNDASVALHQRCGFRIVGVRERIAQKRGEWRDVVLMERRSELVA
jgi:L-amino acid N-acyltransferase YncA